MSFWKRTKAEFLRILRFDLNSHWELLYHDIAWILVGLILSFPIQWVVHWLFTPEATAVFINDKIRIPVETHVVKRIAPPDLSTEAYAHLTATVIILIEFAFLHLLNWGSWRLRVKDRGMKMKPSTKDSGRYSVQLPLFTKKNTYQDEVPLWTRFISEVKRVLRLDLHSCWEVFYLDIMIVLAAYLLSFPFCFFIYHFHLEKTVYDPVIEYIEKPLENQIIRVVAPAGLAADSYRLITLIAMQIFVVIVFHVSCCYTYVHYRDQKPEGETHSGKIYQAIADRRLIMRAH